MSTIVRLPQVGDYVEVWWDGDERSYRGHLVKKRGRVHPFRFDFDYDDGDRQTHDLNEERWCFVDMPDKWYEPGDVEELKRELSERPFSAWKGARAMAEDTAASSRGKRVSNRQASVEAVKRLKLLSEDALGEAWVAPNPEYCNSSTYSAESKPLLQDDETTGDQDIYQPGSFHKPHELTLLQLDDVNAVTALSANLEISNCSPLTVSTPPPPPLLSTPGCRPCPPAVEVDNSVASTLDSVSEGSNARLENHLPQRKRLLARYYENNASK